MINTALFGSCVARDVLALGQHVFDVQLYFRRSSIISLMSPPLACRFEDTPATMTNFFRKSIYFDFQKLFFEMLEKVRNNLDILIFEFIDERFDLVEIKGTYCTLTPELLQWGYLNDTEYKVLSRTRKETIDLWDEKFDRFVVTCKDYYNLKDVILMESYASNQYLDKGVKYISSDASIAHHMKLNENLKHYNRRFKDAFKCRVLPHSEKYALLNPNHKWGFSPYHLIDEYYTDAYNGLLAYAPENLVKNLSCEAIRKYGYSDKDPLGLPS